ncbi:hypothetical protein FDP41_005855 [Naegleria fowleri]|uniref:Uncharacterized protein n=1 Tax=Naegleria fowleri TaxID=5763 RepID=A0A6A5BJP3_NAEFO|nr:uncharacterized protein FDP41_005855 [Naegleria fowleri]KAF0975102.1 hypothetical protein FDP41_005855 [Naegleria fowleri]
MQQACTNPAATTAASSSNPKKKPYKSALREEMAKTFGKFIVQEREQKVSNNKLIEAKPKTASTDFRPTICVFSNALADDTPHSSVGGMNQTIFDKFTTPNIARHDSLTFQYTTFSEDDDEYTQPITDINEFVQKFLSNTDDEEEYDDGDGFALITTSKPKPCAKFDTFTSNSDSQFDDFEPTTPKTRTNISTFDFTSAPTNVSSNMFDECSSSSSSSYDTFTSEEGSNNNSWSGMTRKPSGQAPRKASVALFAKPIETDRLDDEFQALKKFETRLQRKSGMHTSGYRQHNLSKNRYKNILPNENTRVLLKSRERLEPGSDYINANHIITHSTQHFKHIKLSSPPTYIATQAPLPCTFCDFWRMIVEHNSTIIVMLSNEIVSSDSESDGEAKEGTDLFDQCFNKNKVNKYWPSLHEKKQYDEVTVETILQEVTPYDFTYRQFLVYHETLPSSGRLVHFYQYTGWPDMGVPDNTDSFFKLIECIDNLKKRPDYIPGPITIHCSAGVGRTGTFCTIHILLSQYKEYLRLSKEERDNDTHFDFNIYKIVKQLKNLRVGMVQRKEQYRFCYTAVRDGINHIHQNL